MIKDKHLKQITAIIKPYIKGKKVQVFLFGSSVKKEKFGDFDIGLLGEVDESIIRELKQAFANSTIPYNVDVVDFNQTTASFKNNVFNQPIIWIKH